MSSAKFAAPQPTQNTMRATKMGRHQVNVVALSKEERAFLEKQIKHGAWRPREVIRAKILLLTDVNGSDPLEDKDIVQKLGCSIPTIVLRRRRFAETGSIEDTIFDKARSGRPTIIDGTVDAHMTTIACSTPPEGRSKWTLRLIKDRLVTLEIVDSISHTTVGDALKKKASSHG